MNEPIRVAQIVGKMVNGGVESVVMNYFKHIDRSKVQFDFYVDADSTVDRSEEIESLGGKVFIIPPYQNIFRYISALIKLFRENKYIIVHSYMNTLSVFPLFAAWVAGVPVRVAHNLSAASKGETKRNIMKYILRPFSKVFATDYAACSNFAGEWLFGKKSMERGDVTIFNNAIELDRFKHDESVRSEVRKELGLEGKLVIGHAGRFCFQKNQEFLIDVFEEIYRREINAMLLLVGDGPNKNKVEEKVNILNLKNRVLFLGSRNDLNRLYQAMDVFVLPSRYEGLPVVGVEAQAAGLPCVFSTNITKEVELLNTTVFIDLTANKEMWAAEILKCIDKHAEQINLEQFDITLRANELTQYYITRLNIKNMPVKCY